MLRRSLGLDSLEFKAHKKDSDVFIPFPGRPTLQCIGAVTSSLVKGLQRWSETQHMLFCHEICFVVSYAHLMVSFFPKSDGTPQTF